MIEKLVEVPSLIILLFLFCLFVLFFIFFPTKLGLFLLQVVSLALSGNAATRSHSIRMDDKVARLVADIKKWKGVEKVATKRLRKHALKANDAKKKGENLLAFT